MKFEWQKWNIGGKIIFVSTCAAVLSMFMKWVDIGIISQTGLSQQGFLLLAFYIYPFMVLLKNKKAIPFISFCCAVLAIGAIVSYINSKSLEIFGTTANVAASGAWLFLLSSIGLLFGIILYRPFGRKEKQGRTIKLGEVPERERRNKPTAEQIEERNHSNERSGSEWH